ncbi:hypothetical protein JCM3765_004627 [Sporobolomyces pararoseus]
MTSEFICSLPEETLDQIFSSNLQQSDLAILCRVTKQFLTIVRPLLYHSVTFDSRRQTEEFSKSRPEDVQLVESVKVVGKGNPWEIVEMSALDEHFKELNVAEKVKSEAGVVKRLLGGEIVNSAQLKSIFVHQVVEEPSVVWDRGFAVHPRVFANLTELSIVSHRGGVNVFESLFNLRYLPVLQRLTLCDVLYCDPGGIVPVGDGPFMLTTSLGVPLVKKLDPSDYDCLEGILESQECDLFEGTKLKLLVSPSYNFLEDHPSLIHLTVFSKRYGIGEEDKYVLVYKSTRANSNEEIDNAFDKLQAIATDFVVYSLKYLVLPSSLEHQLSAEKRTILNDLINLGVAVHFDGDLGSVIAPPSFFQFLEHEEAKAGHEDEVEAEN